MFDLEQSIADWRKQMLAAGIKTPVPLGELEIHLREEIEQQMKSGSNEQMAFDISVQQIGKATMLKNEFRKADGAKESREWKLKQILFFAGVGLISVFITTCVIFKLGTFAETSPARQISGLLAVAAMLFLVNAGYFGYGLFPIILNSRVRIGVCIFSVILMSFWWAIFFFVILPRVDLTMDQLVVTILWGFVAPFGALAGFVTGLEKAAHKKNEQYV